MNVLFVSTLGHNPGDDFIRWGQQHLLRLLVPEPQFETIHKHDPRTLFTDFSRRPVSPHRLIAPILYRWHSMRTRAPNRLAHADLVAFAGTPFIWRQNTWLLPSTTANAEWVRPIWRLLMDQLRDTPVINLAAGTSLNSDQTMSQILADSRVSGFLGEAVRRSAVTTARDQLTASILKALGQDIPVLACTSLWAAAGAGLKPQQPEYVAVNVMRGAVHSARGKRTTGSTWQVSIRKVVDWLAERHKLTFVCHSTDEFSVAREWFPQHQASFSTEPRHTLAAYGRALYTVSNRVHGAGGAASFGRPALGIGGDSRIELLEPFGLPFLRADGVTSEKIIAECERIERDYDRLAEALQALSRSEEQRYLELLKTAGIGRLG